MWKKRYIKKSVETGLGGERQYDGLDVHVHPYGEEEILNELRQSKSRCKTVFTRYRHQLLVLLDEVDMPSCTQIRHTKLFFSQNRQRMPFWMTENHFRSHFSSFQINTQLYFVSQNGCRRPFWMTENHFQSHFSPF